MSLLQRTTTRTIKGTTETTSATDSPSSTTLAFNLQTTDRFYMGFRYPFASRYFHFDVENQVVCTVAVKYWDGEQFSPVEDLIDGTKGFTRDGFLSWKNVEGDWEKKAQDGVADEELYWLEVSVNANLSADTALQAVLNLFCDTDFFRTLYPEMVSDTRWLPPGREDLLEQLVAAKDFVVTRLKQLNAIKDEAEVLDVEQVAIAAAHATAYVLALPTEKSDEGIAYVGSLRKLVDSELNRIAQSFDRNHSGTIEPKEEGNGQQYRVRW